MPISTPFRIVPKFTGSNGAIVNFKTELASAWVLDYLIDADGVVHPLIFIASGSLDLLCHSFTETHDIICRTSCDKNFAYKNIEVPDNAIGGHNSFTYETYDKTTNRIAIVSENILNSMFSPLTAPIVDYELVCRAVDNFCHNLRFNISEQHPRRPGPPSKTRQSIIDCKMLRALCEVTRIVYEPSDYENAIINAVTDPELLSMVQEMDDDDAEQTDTLLYVRSAAELQSLLKIPICVDSITDLQLWNPGFDKETRADIHVSGLIVADLTVWRPFRRDTSTSWVGICLFKLESLPNRTDGFVCVPQLHTIRAISKFVETNVSVMSVDPEDTEFVNRLRARDWIA